MSATVPPDLDPSATIANRFFERRSRRTIGTFGSPNTPRTVALVRKPANQYPSDRRCRFPDWAIAQRTKIERTSAENNQPRSASTATGANSRCSRWRKRRVVEARLTGEVSHSYSDRLKNGRERRPSDGRSSAMSWLRELDESERRTMLATGGGWALDAFDVQVYSMSFPR